MTANQEKELNQKGKVTITYNEFRKEWFGGEANPLEEQALGIAGIPETEDNTVLFVSAFTKGQYKPEKVFPSSRKVPKKGWALFFNEDDYGVAIFKDGTPVLGIYMSTRGELYHAGLYIHDGQSHYYATNLHEKYKDKGWLAVGRESLDAQIAREFLLGDGQ